MLPPAPIQPRRVSLKQTVWTSDGVAIGRQCAPPSVVARNSDVPVTQPCLASAKSTVPSCPAGLVRNWITQWRPPSAVCRIRSDPTTQPANGDTNCTPVSTVGRPDVPASTDPPAAPQERFGDGLGERSPCCFAGGADCPTGAWAAVPHPAASMAANPSMSPVSRPGALVDRGFITSVTALAASTLSP